MIKYSNLEYNIATDKKDILYFKDLNDNDKTGFNACIGKKENEELLKIDFTKNPHLLIGGSSGSGKSCLMNCILTSLINKYDFNLVVIDIKQVEYLQYKNNKNLFVPIKTTVTEAYDMLDKMIQIMQFRYNLLAKKEYKSISEWNKKEDEQLKRYVICIDELAHLMLGNRHIKNQLQQLLQLGRAVGIHCILATQAPNCKTIPTELKININCRIALQVPTTANSKIIIDEKGAETLRGNGDGLLRVGNTVERFQTALIEE